jgi:D-beta-D-heptose 7-phosphate kinase/D-beta-D-heptose 1-phosphate adenosyltransferase
MSLKIWVNGTFDVLHRGHLELLEYASSMGTLRVGIDTDERVKEKKGNDRPINTLQDRLYNMSRIKGVDSVVDFGSDVELEDRIKEWGTDILIVGSDYKDKKVIGSQHSKKLMFFDKIEGFSSTKIIDYEKNISNR